MKNRCLNCEKIYSFPTEDGKLNDPNYSLYWEGFCSEDCARKYGFIDQYNKLIDTLYYSLNPDQKEIFNLLFEEGRLGSDDNYFARYILGLTFKNKHNK